MDTILGLFGVDSLANLIAYGLSILFGGSIVIFHKAMRYFPVLIRILSVGTVARDFLKTINNAYKDKKCTPAEAKQILAKCEKLGKAVIGFQATEVPEEVFE